jgi:hypothetical protein
VYLHVTNGDCAAETLRQVVDGPVVTTVDLLYEGPAPRVEGDAWYDVRARHLAAGGCVTYDQARESLSARDREIAEACVRSAGSASASGSGGYGVGDNRDEIVLWFEHDLYDQLLLIRTLCLVSNACANTPGPPHPPRVSLICIDRFPGVERFVGLGQLTAAQLATLVDSRRPVTPEQYALAAEAWDAFRSPDPGRLLALADRLEPGVRDGRDAAALPFLGDAIRRFFAEFPSAINGLSRTETLALTGLSDGPRPAGELFEVAQALESRPFMGDWSFYATLRGLAAAAVPLVTLEAGSDDRDLRPRLVALTGAGREVLAGGRDHIALNGIDMWRGGVHLEGTGPSLWRWDARRETLVS